MNRRGAAIRTTLVMAGLALALAACSSSSGTSATTTGAPTSTAPTSTAPGMVTSSPSSAPVSASAVATAVNPCDLVTAQEASQLSGASYAKGKEEDVPGGQRRCVYGAGTTNIVTVGVVQAASADEAAAAQKQLLAEAKQKLSGKISVTELPSLADGGAELRGSYSLQGVTLAAAGIYARKGAYGFGISNVVLGQQAPTDAALQALATTAAGRLP